MKRSSLKHRSVGAFGRLIIFGVTGMAALGVAWVGIRHNGVSARAAEREALGPALQNVIASPKAANITATTADIIWTTEHPLTSQVEYGPTVDLGSLSAFDSVAVTYHSVTLRNLVPGSAYHYTATSTDSEGQVIKSANLTFKTEASAGTPVITRVAAQALPTTATITWTSDKPSSSQVEYGVTNSYGLLSAFNSSLVTSHAVILTGLAPGTHYEVSALSTDAAGQVGKSDNFAFTTAGAAGPPVITLMSVGAITANTATVSWATDQPSASQVAFGPTQAYGTLSSYNASLVTSHSITLTGLAPGKTYDCAALSANELGRVGTSANLTFATVEGPVSSAQRP